MTGELNEALLDAVRAGSRRWQDAFNAGNAAGCAACYEETAVMNAKPFGAFSGRADIEAFWTKIIGDGYSDVTYIEPEIRVVDDRSAILSAKWEMNKAFGVITNELWVLQDDGNALLREDDFEVLG